MEKDREKTSSRIPSLDGLRALAILLVIEGHLNDRFTSMVKWIPGYGATGVQLFFVISGFIITHNLLKEQLTKNNINLKHFWIRRIFRIYPAFFVFMFSIGLFFLFIERPFELWSFIVYFFLLGSIIPVSAGWYLGHAWSLSVEQFFYILWPPLMKYGFGIKFLIASIIAWPFVRGAYYLLCEKNKIIYFPISDLVYNYIFMASGCLLAFLINKYSFSKLSQNKWRFMFYILFFYPFFQQLIFENYLIDYKPAQTYITSFSPLPVSFCFSFSILYLIKSKDHFLYYIFNNKISCYIGSISYSLYLVQQFFAIPERYMSFDVQKFPVNIVLMLIFTLLLYYSIEVPFIKIGQKLFAQTKPKT